MPDARHVTTTKQNKKGSNSKRAWYPRKLIKSLFPLSGRSSSSSSSSSSHQRQIQPPQWSSTRRSFLISLIPSIRKRDRGYDHSPHYQRKKISQRSNSVMVSNTIAYQQRTKPCDEKELLQMDATKRSHADLAFQQPLDNLAQISSSSPRRCHRPPFRRPMSEDLSTYMVSSHVPTTSVDDYDNKSPFFVWVQRKSDVLPLSSIGNDSMTTTMPTVSETGISSCSSITATASDPSSYDLIIHNTVAPDDIDKSKHHHQQHIDATTINNNNNDNNMNTTLSTSATSPSLLRRLSSSLGRGSVPRPPRRTTSLAIPSSTMQHRESNDYSAQTPTSSAPSLLISRSFSLSSYYKRRFSALVSGSHGDYGLTNSKQDEAVAFWRSTVAQIEAPYSSTAVLNTEQKDLPPQQPPNPPITPYQQLCSVTPIGKNSNRAVCKFILRELYATETSYHHLLKFIYCKYMQPMNIALQEQNNPLFTRQSSADVVTLFAHLPQLLQLSEHLIPSLEHAMAVQDSKGAARAFISLRERLVIFLRYTIHYQSNFRFIRKMCQTNPMLLHIERECQSHHDTRRMGIADYLIAPIQRVPRYCLLLQDLLKHTSPYDQSHHVIKKSVALVTSLADTMNLYSI